ncbi:MAG TPA: metallopeptidase family protein [Opitutaceae bacterium]|nr:metallopeptidase family protein [Opitutaceae bacterium]
MKESRLIRLASEAVAATQRKLPPDIREAARSVPVRFEPAPGADVLADGFESDLLGLFTGSPLGAELAGGNPEPPRIFLYTANLWDYAEEDVEAFRDEVRLTYLHELGHFLGWDEDQIAARGLD